MQEDQKLIIIIKNNREIELLDFAQAFFSLGEEYKRFLSKEKQDFYHDIKLFIKEVKPGSIEIELIALALGVFEIMAAADTILSFAERLRKLIMFLTGEVKTKPEWADKTSLENTYKLLEMTAKDRGSQLVIAPHMGGNAVFNLHLGSKEANAAQNAARREIDLLEAPAIINRDSVWLRWYQARSDLGSAAGNKAIIMAVSPNPTKTVFDNPNLKSHILLQDDNPFRSEYMVDVRVEMVEDIPKLYTITKYHKLREIPEE